MKSLIKKYDSEWPLQFEKLKAIFLSVLQDIKVDVEHVGSTAVPNLAAKNIIDIDIVYYDENQFEMIRGALESLNYYHNGDQGIAGREVFKRVKDADKKDVLDTISHHLYVCHSESSELKRHILFRDFLRKNSKTRERYEMIKIDIAKQAHNDRKSYAALKEKLAKRFVNDIVIKAATPKGS